MSNSSSKSILYHIQTPGTVELEEKLGFRLEKLSRREKYELIEFISGYLFHMVEGEGDDALPEGAWNILDYQKQYRPGYKSNILVALYLLKDEKVQTFCDLLPAIAEYARDDK